LVNATQQADQQVLHAADGQAFPKTVEWAFKAIDDVAAAEAYTWRLAHQHYENFTVVSRLVPRRLRQDFCNIYAFCRTADDLGDEVGNRNLALNYLAQFRQQTLDCFAGTTGTAVFTALSATIKRFDLPSRPFLDLISAFEQDQRLTRYPDFPTVLDYCTRSANPVGHLVLYLSGYRDAQRQMLADKTCTALQLANFWQDVRRDLLERDRIYLPADSMARFGVTEEDIRIGRCTDGFRQMLRFEVQRCREFFQQGEALLDLVASPWREQISLFGRGGRAVLAAIERQNYDTLSSRPVVRGRTKWALMLSALLTMGKASLSR
jgi:squalene synthase HpnC